MNNNENLVRLLKMALVAALYVALTFVFMPFSFLGVQFRVAEILMLLVLIDPLYIPALTIGCFIANLLFSPMALIDAVVGTSATLFAVIAISKTKNLFIASLWPTIFNAFIVGAELYYVLNFPFWLSTFQVAIGEFTVVSIVGVIVFKYVLNNRGLVNVLKLK
ncbi:hypothetical protein SDC9_77834 [bioreactor metagenome]|uniref:Queuosine transporter QueT n=1 Tax=bioreactor metagenome TaxID=1076179 RepID=A0A644YSH5_9ZZZZ